MTRESDPNERKQRHLLAVSIMSSRLSDRERIDHLHYPHADRDLNTYEQMIPHLGQTIQRLKQRFGNQLKVHDAGCGTGRAAEKMRQKYGVDVIGSTLTYFPHSIGSLTLPRDKIHIGRSCRVKGPFHLILAVGSLSVSLTMLDDGPKLIDQLVPRGCFILVETANPSGEPLDEGQLLMEQYQSKFKISHGSQPVGNSQTYYYIFQSQEN